MWRTVSMPTILATALLTCFLSAAFGAETEGLANSETARATLSAALGSKAEPIALMSDVAARLNKAAVISGRFEQSKTISGFKNPLISSGEFAVARDHGIFWHTRAPFESLLSVNQDRIASRHADGELQTLVGLGEEAILRTVNEVLFAIMTADLPLLSQKFDVSGRLPQEKHWELDLVPRDAMLQQWLSRVQLWGDSYVQKVVLHEAQGDRSVIVLSEHKAGSKVPDALLGQ